MGMLLIDPGRLRHAFSLQAATPVGDGLGGHGEAWREVALVHGMVEPVRARSVTSADQRLATVTHQVTLRHREGVRIGMRLKRRQRAFLILTAHDPDQSGRYLVCQVEETGEVA